MSGIGLDGSRRGASRMRADIPLALIDVVVVVAAYTILLGARFDFSVPSQFWESFRVFLPVACIVHVVANLCWGGYGRTWRHASIDEARRLLAAGVTSGVILIALFAWDVDPVPLSVLIAGPMAATFLMGLVRFQSRLFAIRRSSLGRPGLRLAVVGGGTEAAAAIREMQSSQHLGLVPVVVVDDDRTMRHRSIHGVLVAGDVEHLVEVITEHRVDQVLLAIPDGVARGDPPRRRRRRHHRRPRAACCGHRRRGCTACLASADLRDLDIADLLRRQSVTIDLEPVRQLLTGKRVLVTGGGGWIGAEIARQVAEFDPASLVILDHDETHLHDAAQRGAESAELALVDIRDATVLSDLFARVKPEVVFHAAAHKHVPILEDFACEALKTNVFGSLNLLRACEEAGTSQVVFISTDKAATPTSVMGASKWLAEQLMLAHAPARATAPSGSGTCWAAAAA